MYQLAENIIAVEVPADATGIALNTECYNNKSVLSGYLPKNGTFIKDLPKEAILVGVTPLSVRECAKVVEKWDRYFPMKHTVYRNYLKPTEYSSVKQSTEQGWSDCFGLPTESFDTLLQSKGLDPNKKYAIIKIEKK